MNFGDILDQWEKRGSGESAKDAASGREEAGTLLRGERRSRLLRKKPDDFIDLHGLNRAEAWAALDTFFECSRQKGCEKLLVIHGKGNHYGNAESQNKDPHLGEGALRDLSRHFIESCPFAGESGYSSAKDGGTGATWVILKEPSAKQ